MALPTYTTGTASVAVAGTVVTGVGTSWSGINVKQGDYISIGGSDAVLITEVTDTTHLKIPPWPSTVKTAQPYVIYQNYVGRVVGVAAAEDVGVMLEKLHVDGLPFIVDSSATVPDPSYGDDGQMAFQPSTGKWWVKTGGVWVLSAGLSADSTKVLKAGDTMTGLLVLSANPSAALGAATKQYVDVGTTTNDNATAGNKGQFISSNIVSGSAVVLTTGVAANVTSISLTAGDWDVDGVVGYVSAASTSITTVAACIGNVSATVPTAPNNTAPMGGGGMNFLRTAAFVPGATTNAFQLPTGKIRVSLTATTTIYLISFSGFTVAALSAYGYIGARRVR